MMRYEAGEWSDFSKHSHFVDLFDDSIEDFSFEGSEDYSFVFDRIHYESLAWLNDSRADLVNSCHCDNETVFSSASSLHFRIQFLLHCFQELWTEVAGMQEDFMF